ncbi:MAG: BsuPI-related putative proteinase inhibitor [Thalassolituus sp.]
MPLIHKVRPDHGKRIAFWSKRTAVVVACSIFCLTGCGGDDKEGIDAPSSVLVVDFYSMDDFSQRTNEFSSGESVLLMYEIANQTNDTVLFSYWAPLYYPSVRTEDANEVWSFFNGMEFDLLQISEELGPHQKLVRGVLWQTVNNEGKPVSSGRYIVPADFSVISITSHGNTSVSMPEPIELEIR